MHILSFGQCVVSNYNTLLSKYLDSYLKGAAAICGVRIFSEMMLLCSDDVINPNQHFVFGIKSRSCCEPLSPNHSMQKQPCFEPRKLAFSVINMEVM